MKSNRWLFSKCLTAFGAAMISSTISAIEYHEFFWIQSTIGMGIGIVCFAASGLIDKKDGRM